MPSPDHDLPEQLHGAAIVHVFLFMSSNLAQCHQPSPPHLRSSGPVGQQWSCGPVVPWANSPMSEARLYRYVTYKTNSRGKAGWVAQVLQDGRQVTLGGLHASQAAAAKVVAKFKGTTVQELRLPASAPAGTRSRQSKPAPVLNRPLKKYVYRRGPSYVAIKGNQYLGSFPAAAQAEAAVASLLPGDSPVVKPKKVPPAELLARLAAGMKVYDGYEPPDLESLAQEFQRSSGHWAVEPSLAFLSALGKYGTWRDRLFQHVSQAKLLAGQSAALRAQAAMDILHATVQDMQGVAAALAAY